jgi:nicotinamidase-related amidase
MKTALIVIDLIEDYFDRGLWPDSCIPENRDDLDSRSNDLVAVCRGHEVPIFWVRQEFEPDLSNAFQHMLDGGRSYAVRGTPGSQLLSELNVQPTDTVLTKHRFSAFYETRLAELLADRGIDTVILAGITTSWCVRSTAVDAYQRDLTVVLAKDCMAGFTERDHEESLSAMDGYIAKACSNREIEHLFS